MRRIYSNYAYGPGPRDNCWWDETIPAPVWDSQTGEIRVDVTVVGGGFTGLSAALHLAEAGASVAVLEAERPAGARQAAMAAFVVWVARNSRPRPCCANMAPRPPKSTRRAKRRLSTWWRGFLPT